MHIYVFLNKYCLNQQSIFKKNILVMTYSVYISSPFVLMSTHSVTGQFRVFRRWTIATDMARKPNFTQLEIETLIEEVQKNREILNSSFSNVSTNAKKTTHLDKYCIKGTLIHFYKYLKIMYNFLNFGGIQTVHICNI